MAGSFNSETISQNQQHIMRFYDDPSDFVGDVESIMKTLHGASPYNAILHLAKSGDFLAYDADIRDYLTRIGYPPTSKYSTQQTRDFYNHLMARDGSRLYDLIKSGRTPSFGPPKAKVASRNSTGGGIPSKVTREYADQYTLDRLADYAGEYIGHIRTWGISDNDEEIRALSGGKPMVLLDDISPDPVFDSVYTACAEGGEAAVRHLIDIGCKHILIVGGTYEDLADDGKSTGVSARRMLGSLQALEEAGMPIDPGMFLPLAPWDPETARACAHRIADSGRPVDGVFGMTDTIALGLIRGFADRGIRVPEDVAVIGFDGISEGECFIPSLSTIRTDLDDLARKAMGLLLKRIDGDSDDAPVRLTADYKLVVRESTRRQAGH